MNRVWRVLPFLLLTTAWAGHFAIIAHYVVDIPFGDEWDLLSSDALKKPLDLAWLMAPHNEHRIAVTRFYSWLLYRVDHLDFAHQQLVNYGLFTLAALALLWFTAYLAPTLPKWVIACFAIFLLSPLNHENHFWAFQSQFHFCLLFVLLTLRFLFGERPWRAVPFALLAIVSFSSSVVMLGAALAVFVARAVVERRALGRTIAVAAVIGSGLAAWFFGHQSLQSYPRPTLVEAVDFFFGLINFGFGVRHPWAVPTIVTIAFIVMPLLLLLLRRHAWQDEDWALYGAVAAVLAACAIITLGRGSLGFYQSKSSRYFELAVPLVLLAMAAWHRAVANSKRVIIALFLYVFGAMIDDWSFNAYDILATRRHRGIECLRRKLAAHEPLHCDDLYPIPIDAEVARAKELEVPFYRTLIEARAPNGTKP